MGGNEVSVIQGPHGMYDRLDALCASGEATARRDWHLRFMDAGFSRYLQLWLVSRLRFALWSCNSKRFKGIL